MSELALPHDLTAERHLLGACMMTSSAIAAARGVVEPGDFHHPSHRLIFASLADMHAAGERVDPITVADSLRSRRHRQSTQLEAIGGGETLLAMLAEAPAPSNTARYSAIVVDHSRRRRIMQASLAAAEAASCFADPADVIGDLTTAVERIDLGNDGPLPDRYWTVDQFLDRPDEARAPWVVPALLRRDWRVVVVAGEGSGKTNLLRCLAGYTAHGLHPFVDEMCEPSRALIVDLENPDEHIDDTFRAIRRTVRQFGEYDTDRWHVWSQPGGMDIRRRVDFARLESTIADARPDLLVIGPAYKLFNQTTREDSELVAKDVLSRLDDLRTRHRFALVVEHHAPKGEGGRKRELIPFGSSTWMRWPELGLSLSPWEGVDAGWKNGHLLKLGRWRPDRVVATWPEWLSRAEHRLWAGHYDVIAPRPQWWPS